MDKSVIRLIVELFAECGWEWWTQPANTPLSNIMDAAMFPALAKAVSKIGGLTNGGRYLQGNQLWEALQQAWNNYPEDKIARSFVHHAQVAAAIYDCEGGDDFVRQHKGLSFGVRKVCRPYYGEDAVGEEGDLDLSSFAPRELMAAKGVVVEEIEEGVDEEAAAKLKYPVPDMGEHDVGEHLSFAALEMVATNLWSAPDYDSLTEEEKGRYNKFAVRRGLHLKM